jgi:hypothetical protein
MVSKAVAGSDIASGIVTVFVGPREREVIVQIVGE